MQSIELSDTEKTHIGGPKHYYQQEKKQKEVEKKAASIATAIRHIDNRKRAKRERNEREEKLLLPFARCRSISDADGNITFVLNKNKLTHTLTLWHT